MTCMHRAAAIGGGLWPLFSPVLAGAAGKPAAVDAARLNAADREAGNWMSHGRTYGEQRFSTLSKVNEKNIDQLDLAWQFKYDLDRVVEATPIVVDGVLYTTGAYSMVYALDASNGKLLWKYDPEVHRGIQGSGCCDAANCGVAVWKGRVYVGVYDGRLVALDAGSGREVWSVDTVIDHERNYTITGAPRIVKGKVIIGNGGAEFGVRGYVTAYDAATGKQAWRFFTVPGDPAKGDESDTIAMIRKTWFGDQYWKQGGGGTAWNAMAYDPELDLLYIGIGNGSFWKYGLRFEGRGDDLFMSSIVAVRPDTGKYVWHYQTTPGDAWDYTATQDIIVATLPIDGKPRKVVMQAPKNGFFYVLDAATGQFISAEKFGSIVTWAKGIDKARGRQIFDAEAADYWTRGEAKLVFQGTTHGELVAYAADSGRKLWQREVSSGVVAGPVTYEVRGEQCVAFNVGWGGAVPIAFGAIAQRSPVVPDSRLFVFKLGGTAAMAKVRRRVFTSPPPQTADAETVQAGRKLYADNCGACHGFGAMSANVIPDLRYLDAEKHKQFEAIVSGARSHLGMPPFGDRLEANDIEKIRAFLIRRAHDLKDEIAAAQAATEDKTK